MKKYYIIGAISVAVIVAGVLYFSGVFSSVSYNLEPREEPDFESMEEYKAYYENLVEVYKKDDFGSSTPEATLQAFIDALEEGKTDRAAKYFIPEKEERLARELAIGEKNEVIQKLLQDLKKDNKKIKLSENKVRFRTYDDQGIAEFSYDLVYNSYTDVWKIESL